MADAYASNSMMTGTPSVADYADILVEEYQAVLQEGAQRAALALQDAARSRARALPQWEGLDQHIEAYADRGDLVLGTRSGDVAGAFRKAEYGAGPEAAAPVLTTTMTGMLTPMGQIMQRTIDEAFG